METSVKSMDDKFKSQVSIIFKKFISLFLRCYSTVCYKQISENPVVIYSKSTCGYCKKARYVLDSENINYLNVELDQIEDGKDLYKSVHAVTKSAYVPQIFICKKYIGGSTLTFFLNSISMKY